MRAFRLCLRYGSQKSRTETPNRFSGSLECSANKKRSFQKIIGFQPDSSWGAKCISESATSKNNWVVILVIDCTALSEWGWNSLRLGDESGGAGFRSGKEVASSKILLLTVSTRNHLRSHQITDACAAV